MKVTSLINTTIIPVGMTAAQAREARKKGEPENVWRSTIKKGETYEVPDELGAQWIKNGVAKAADGSSVPDPKVAEQVEQANRGQGNVDPSNNLQHPQLADEAAVAVANRINRLARRAPQAQSEQQTEEPAQTAN